MRRREEEQHRAAIYCRVSTQEMTNPQFDSLDGQEARCRDFARAKGWAVVDVFADASTGSNTDRLRLREMLDRGAAGELDVVLVYKLDRLSRRLLDFLELVDRLSDQGVAVASVTESFETATPQGESIPFLVENVRLLPGHHATSFSARRSA